MPWDSKPNRLGWNKASPTVYLSLPIVITCTRKMVKGPWPSRSSLWSSRSTSTYRTVNLLTLIDQRKLHVSGWINHTFPLQWYGDKSTRAHQIITNYDITMHPY
jgi:hypothetical protein